jgi:hypothetical protein
MWIKMSKPGISFREFKSYGPHDLEDIILEAARKSAEDKFKPKAPKVGGAAARHHGATAMEHEKSAHHLEQAAGYVTSTEHHEQLKRMAAAYKEAGRAHRAAETAHNEYENKGMVGSGQRRKDAKRSTEEADRATQIAHETT